MTTTNDQVDTNKDDNKVNFDDALKKIEEQLSEKITQGVQSLEEKIKKPEPKEDDTFDFSDEEDENLSKKDIPVIIEQVTKTVLKAADKKNETIMKKQRRDAQTLHEFPQLDTRSPLFSKKFASEFDKEVKQRLSDGRSNDDADLIYDCATATAIRGMKEKWFVPESQARRATMHRNARGDSFDVNETDQDSTKPSEGTLRLAKKAGLSEKEITQYLESKRKSR